MEIANAVALQSVSVLLALEATPHVTGTIPAGMVHPQLVDVSECLFGVFHAESTINLASCYY